MMSKPMQESYEEMLRLGKRVKHNNYHNNVVHLVTIEGSVLTLNNACYIEDPFGPRGSGNTVYVWVYTEHSGELIFAKDEIVFIAQYKKVKGNDIVYIEK